MRTERTKSLKFRDLPDDEKRIMTEEAAGIRTIRFSVRKTDESWRKDCHGQLVEEGAL